MDKKYYVYKFLNDDQEVLYVGKTTNLKDRIFRHFHSGHLSPECYSEVSYIRYIECKTDLEMTIKEIYFIDKYKPKYNSVFVNDESMDPIEDLDNIKWDKEYKIEKQAKVIGKDLIKTNDINKLKNKIITLNKLLIDTTDKFFKTTSDLEWYKYLAFRYKELLLKNKIDIQEIKNIENYAYWSKYNEKYNDEEINGKHR